MATKRDVDNEYTRISTFKEMVEALEEIAANRMQNTRSYVLRSRTFIDELDFIFQQVKHSYKSEVERLMKEKKGKDAEKFSFLKKNGKTVFILLSANAGLYGGIIRETFNFFLDLIKKESADVAIIGRVGREYFRESDLSIPHTDFDMPDSGTDNESLKKIVNYILQYQRVFVVYPRFDAVTSQHPAVTGISGDILPQEQNMPYVKYFFEPSLDKILQFFEAEIFASLFEQTLFESRLAKFASRMTTLELRAQKIKDILKNIYIERGRIRHRIQNKKQLETFASMSLWR